jgi:hypothetical protein
MNRSRQPLRFGALNTPRLTFRSATASAGCEDPEIDALLEGFFTERSDVSTAIDTVRSEAEETERLDLSDDGMKAQSDVLHKLGVAVDLAYADYIVQQHDSAASKWSNDGGGEVVGDTQRSLPSDDDTEHHEAHGDDGEGVDLGLSLDLDAEEDANRVLQFDVGGRIFRCKASVVSKYPGKRLHRIVASGCDRFMDTDTFFIDRSARNFEIILDWYRTDRAFLPPGVSQESLEADARYFEVYEDMFPTMAGNETRQTSTSASNDAINLRFSRRERHCLTSSCLPLVYRIRSHEQLVVVSVKGHGKLMVRVCDRSGMQTVHVDQAVLFDSKTRFYLEGDQAHQPLNAMLPGDFVYTLWVEPHSDEGASKKTRPSALDVEFDLLSTYSKGDLVGSVDSPVQRQGQVSPRWDEGVLGNARGTQLPPMPILFLPPFMQALYEHSGGLEPRPRVHEGGRLVVGKVSRSGMNLSAVSPKPKINFVARASAVPRVATLHRKPTNQGNDVPSSPIRRTGAAIISPAKPLGTAQAMDGRITIHRPDKLDFIKR